MSSETPSLVVEASDNSAGAQAILAAAAELFADRGYGAVSMRMIAEHAGFSKANLYHHFSSKEDLYIAVLRTAVSETVQYLETLDRGTESVESFLTRFAQWHLNHLLEREQAYRLLLREMLESSTSKGQKLVAQVIESGFTKLAGIVQEGQACKQLRADVDPALATIVLVAANMLFFQARGMAHELPQIEFADDPQRYSAIAMDVLLHGLKNTTTSE